MPSWPACATPRRRVFTLRVCGTRRIARRCEVFLDMLNFRYASAISRRKAPELSKTVRPEIRGRRECRVPAAPAASRAKLNKAHERSHHRFRRINRHSPRNGFTAYFVLSPARSGLFVTVISRLLGADLTPASRRQNHTTSPSASAPFVTCAARVHRIPPRVRDVRNTPLWDRTMRISELIWVRREGKYFCKRGWTGHPGKHQLICPSGKSIPFALRARGTPPTCPPQQNIGSQNTSRNREARHMISIICLLGAPA
jgi:hypothetical protein